MCPVGVSLTSTLLVDAFLQSFQCSFNGMQRAQLDKLQDQADTRTSAGEAGRADSPTAPPLPPTVAVTPHRMGAGYDPQVFLETLQAMAEACQATWLPVPLEREARLSGHADGHAARGGGGLQLAASGTRLFPGPHGPALAEQPLQLQDTNPFLPDLPHQVLPALTHGGPHQC